MMETNFSPSYSWFCSSLIYLALFPVWYCREWQLTSFTARVSVVYWLATLVKHRWLVLKNFISSLSNKFYHSYFSREKFLFRSFHPLYVCSSSCRLWFNITNYWVILLPGLGWQLVTWNGLSCRYVCIYFFVNSFVAQVGLLIIVQY